MRLWTKDFSLYFTARSVSLFGDALMPVATALAVGKIHGVTGVGLVLSVWTAPFVALILFGGVLSDRFGARRMMIGADIVRVFTQGIVAVAFFTGFTPLWLLIVMSAFAGSATAMFEPGSKSMVPLVTGVVQKANATLKVAESFALLLGPGVAGLLIAFTSSGVVYTVDAATFAVSGACLVALRVVVPKRETATRILHDLKVGWREFRSRTWMWAVILVWVAFTMIVLGPIIPVGATLISGRLGDAAYGWAESALGAGTIIGGLIAMRVRPRRPLFAGGIASIGFCLLPLVVAIEAPLPVLQAGNLVAGAAWAFWSVMWATTIQTQVAPDVMNRVTAYEVAGSVAGLAVGQALAGPVANAIGGLRLVTIGVFVCLGCTIALLSVPAIRDLKRSLKADGPAIPDLEGTT